MSEKKLNGTWSSRLDPKNKGSLVCNVDKVAEEIVKDGWGNFPKHVGDKRAGELVLLAQSYLKYRDKDNNKYPRKSK